RDDEIVVLDDDVRNLRVGKVQRERLPPLTIVERDVDAVFGPRVEEARAPGVLTHRVHVIVVSDAGDDLLPALSVIVGLEDVRLAVVLQVVLHGDVRRAGLVRRRVDDAYPREVGNTRRRDVRPVLAAVTGDVHEPVVRAGPDGVGLLT